MIYPDVTVEEWCKSYPDLLDLDFTECCLECGSSLDYSKPCINEDVIGLAAGPCRCGIENPGLIFIASPKSKRLVRFWAEVKK